MGLDGLLNTRVGALTGILNGIDIEDWDPGTDEHLAKPYRTGTAHLRAGNKRALEEEFELDSDDNLLFGVVSRLTWQKGIDLLAECIDGLVAQGARLCVLGSGDAGLEAAIAEAAARHPGRVALHRGYSEALSHRIQGGADAILVPSRFEPCGLTQLYGLHYGCVPVVARVGGLADTIVDANEAALSAGVATGIQFSPVNAPELTEAIRRTVDLFGQRKVWARMQRRGMKTEVSWEASAARYAAVYRELMGQATTNDDSTDD
jgi:starch synthase